MYNSYDEFKAGAEGQWDRYRAQKPSFYNYDLTLTANKNFEWEDGFKLYKNTKASTLAEQLLGETAMRSNIALLNNFGAVSGSSSAIERGTVRGPVGGRNVTLRTGHVTESARRSRGTWTGHGRSRTRQLTSTQVTTHLRQGSVLNDAYWWPFKNDCWIVGGVHGLKRFHLAHRWPVPDSLLWSDDESRARVLGRELIGLMTFGYTWVAKFNSGVFDESFINLFGFIFAPTDKARAQTATFKDYLDALEACNTKTKLKDLVFKTAKNYSDYDFAAVENPPPPPTLITPPTTPPPTTTVTTTVPTRVEQPMKGGS
jgi:hypothetical protein